MTHENTIEEESIEQNINDQKEDNYVIEITTLSGFVANKENDNSFNELKDRTEKTVMELLAKVHSTTEFDRKALQQTYKNISMAKHLLVSLEKKKNVEVIKVKLKSPPNKNIDKQRRFFSTKKKQKERKVRLAKPLIDEKDIIFKDETDWLYSLGGKRKINKSSLQTAEEKESTSLTTNHKKKPKEKLKKGIATLYFFIFVHLATNKYFNVTNRV